jgi:nitrogenase molybdenum-iron protein alpha/beta subunit
MDAYTSGAGEAFACLVDLMENVEPGSRKIERVGGESSSDDIIKVNLLGATPLDYSLNGSVQAIQELLEDNGFSVRSTWAMGDTLENILSSGDADVNLIISATGFAAAERMRERFGIPYVIGCPVGRAAAERVVSQIRQAAGSMNRMGGSNLADGMETMETCIAAKKMFDGGVFVNPFVPPGVPEGHSLIRTSFMASHTPALVEEAADVIAKALKC